MTTGGCGVSSRRFRLTGGLARSGGTSARSNVVYLDRYRPRGVSPRLLLYVTESARWEGLLASSPDWWTRAAQTPEELAAALAGPEPDLVVLDDTLTWIDPVDVIARTHSATGAAIVMVMGNRGGRSRRTLLKRAFAAGLTDSLLAPLEANELFHTLRLLLHLRVSAAGG